MTRRWGRSPSPLDAREERWIPKREALWWIRLSSRQALERRRGLRSAQSPWDRASATARGGRSLSQPTQDRACDGEFARLGEQRPPPTAPIHAQRQRQRAADRTSPQRCRGAAIDGPSRPRQPQQERRSGARRARLAIAPSMSPGPSAAIKTDESKRARIPIPRRGQRLPRESARGRLPAGWVAVSARPVVTTGPQPSVAGEQTRVARPGGQQR